GFTLRQLARDADVSVAYLSKLERGDSSPTLDVLTKIAGALEISVAELVETSNETETLDLPDSLRAFIGEYRQKFPVLDDLDWQKTLMRVRLRDRYPEDPEDWLKIFLPMKDAWKQ
ncbi:helix-turn-helix domain-containing protein, partial [Escherichia coli]|uniref:helix-turn-helix domain-containing protein n=1 Tax=Escherichia coli TaxID=562 RepID=UPI0013718DE4